MRKILNTIKNVLIIIIIFGFIMSGIDYLRIKNGEVPIFNIPSYNEKTKIETYRGLFYICERKVTTTTKESLMDSTNISYKILIFNINVPKQFKETKLEYRLETKVSDNCTNSTLVYADKNIKIYTYCLDEINIVENNKKNDLSTYLKKDNNFIDDIDSKLDYLGLYKDKTTLMFQSKQDEFTNNELTMYRCNKTNINDVYFVPKDTPMKDDFCTYKDDDFKFIFEIDDESVNKQTKKEDDEKEVIYEDENYRYEFDYPKSQYIYITTPAVRGKEETRTPLMTIINNKTLTIQELIDKGLQVEIINKKEENES